MLLELKNQGRENRKIASYIEKSNFGETVLGDYVAEFCVYVGLVIISDSDAQFFFFHLRSTISCAM